MATSATRNPLPINWYCKNKYIKNIMQLLQKNRPKFITLFISILFFQVINANQFDYLQNIADSSEYVVWLRVVKSEYVETFNYLKNGEKLPTKYCINISGFIERVIKGNDIFTKDYVLKFSYSIRPFYVFDSIGNVIGKGLHNVERPLTGIFATLPDSCYLLFFDFETFGVDTTIRLKALEMKERVCALKHYINKMDDIKNYCKCTSCLLTGECTIDAELEKLKRQLSEESKK